MKDREKEEKNFSAKLSMGSRKERRKRGMKRKKKTL